MPTLRLNRLLTVQKGGIHGSKEEENTNTDQTWRYERAGDAQRPQGHDQRPLYAGDPDPPGASARCRFHAVQAAV